MSPLLEKHEKERQFEAQITEHEALLYKVCHTYAYTQADREDLFQEIVIQVWKAYPNFKGDSKFSTWLYRVAINTAINGLRKRKNFITSYEPEKLPTNLSDDNRSEAEEEQFQQLYKAIGELNQVEKAIVMLYMEDYSYAEMEEILGVSQGSLRVKMTRIKDRLRQLTRNN
jgi:RNA polymerase sigma-70 factor (ECF subfamily)